MTKQSPKKRNLCESESGFSLIEMAMVLTIVALLMAGLLPTLSGQIEQGRRTETRKNQKRAPGLSPKCAFLFGRGGRI